MYFVIAKNTTASELFKSLNEYFTGKLNWSFMSVYARMELQP